jgi:hypothetical protein
MSDPLLNELARDARWDRDRVRGWIEDAFAQTLGLNDSSPDTLVAQAQACGLTPEQLRLWIFDQPKLDWSPGSLVLWALKNGFVRDTPEASR